MFSVRTKIVSVYHAISGIHREAIKKRLNISYSSVPMGVNSKYLHDIVMDLNHLTRFVFKIFNNQNILTNDSNIEAGRGAGAQSVTVNATAGFDSHSMK